VGLGGFPSVFQQYRPATIYPEGMIDKAHNTYLEFAAEMGLPLFLVCIVGFLCVGYLLCRGVLQRQERYLIPLFGISVLLLAGLHSLVDFPLQIPAIGALFVAILTVCTSQTDPRFSELTQISGNAPIKRIRVRKRKKPIVNLKK
jgi:O-antigen ligase